MQIDVTEEMKCLALSWERGAKLKAQDCVAQVCGRKTLVKTLEVIQCLLAV